MGNAKIDMPSPQDVLDKLAAQGSVRQVAEFLAGQGITGWRRVANRCPVSQLVLAETGEEISISLNGWDSRITCGPTPTVVGEFVAGFDRGLFPQVDAMLTGPIHDATELVGTEDQT